MSPAEPRRRVRLLLVMEEVKCGGAEISFFSLCSALAGLCEVHVALSRGSLENLTIRRLAHGLSTTGARLYLSESELFLGTLANLHRSLRSPAVQELAELIGSLRPDVLIVNLPTVERGQTVVDAAELCYLRPPVWGFLHLTQPPSRIGAKLGLVRDLLVPRLIRRFDRLLTVSEAGAREIVLRYGLDPPQVIRPPTEILTPLSPRADRASLRKVQGLPDVFLLGIVGRVQLNHKAQDVALRVTRQLLQDGGALQLIVVGDGPDRQVLHRMVERLGLASSVRFLGWRDDIDALIPLLDLMLMPSRYEGFPQTAVQAVTAHVPVVGYAIGGLAELLPANFMVPPGDENGLVAAVTGVLRGTLEWPAGEVAQRAANWCRPGRVASQVLGLLAGELPALASRRDA